MTSTTAHIRYETANDQKVIWNINRLAFDGEAEADLVGNLRSAASVEVSLVADVDGEVVGPILFSRLSISTNDGIIAAISLAPMSVLPEYQRQGIGSKLVNAGLVECRIKGHQIVTVLGHSDFYPQFGFSSRLAQTLESPFGGGADGS